MAHNKTIQIQMNKMESLDEIIFKNLHCVNLAPKLWSHYILLLWEKSALLVKIVKNAQRRTVHFYLHADANPTSIE